jgi:hypothetical protein
LFNRVTSPFPSVSTADAEALKTFVTLVSLLVRFLHLVVAVNLPYTTVHRDADPLNLARMKLKLSWKRSTLKLALSLYLSSLLLSPPGTSVCSLRTNWDEVV